MASNIDPKTVEGFGKEWSRFDQSSLSPDELQRHFEAYFRIFPWERLPAGAQGFDVGCGSGRWAKLVAPRVDLLHCIDASDAALSVARQNLSEHPNCQFHHASVDALPLKDGSMDFGYSLGVLHHIPDTAAALKSCAKKLKSRAPFLVYLYYRFDNRPPWFRAAWRVSDVARQIVSRLPATARYLIADTIAATVYLPLARAAAVAEAMGKSVELIPLSYYRTASYYTMRTDALDRFGTRLEQRFTRAEILKMLSDAGFDDITFSDQIPFWCAVAFKR